MEILLVYKNFSKWYTLPLREEQILADLEELGYDSSFNLEEAETINRIRIEGQEFEYFDCLADFRIFYQNIRKNDITNKQLLALIETRGVYAIQDVDDYYFYGNAEEYLESVLAGDDRVFQARNGIIVETY